MITLGLDMSSTCIGWAVADCDAIIAYGHADLPGDIAARCERGATEVLRLLDDYAPALVVIESPVARFAKAVIPQARVSGAVLAVLASRRALWHEVPPSVAKALLAGSGAATKREMVAAAAQRLCLGAVELRTHRGKVVTVGLTEDEADAIGLALAGAHVKVVTKEAARA